MWSSFTVEKLSDETFTDFSNNHNFRIPLINFFENSSLRLLLMCNFSFYKSFQEIFLLTINSKFNSWKYWFISEISKFSLKASINMSTCLYIHTCIYILFLLWATLYEQHIAKMLGFVNMYLENYNDFLKNKCVGRFRLPRWRIWCSNMGV